MSEHKIEQYVPMIENDVPVPRKLRYPFVEMKVGDSFAFPIEKLHTVQVSSSAYAKRNAGIRFVVRAHDLRCWRVS